ncbi:hypothetical protein GT347_20385 [Xylophilus rhododendri]|uniref:Uncharacterized protein n=1 Tax=Xylophilus rhododendri TaxID=2697032 RepID=A0A857J7V7_9BURK|nr:hypothetical protein GT347_20385 [Xylophilus rhododendri]
MQKPKSTLTALLLPLVLSACASSPRDALPVAVTCPRPPAPPAWTMQPPSNSPQLVDSLFSISRPPSLPTK